MERKKKHRGDLHLHLLLHKEGLLVQILARLPVVFLLRFKSVCKSWCDLIESSHFVDLHTTTTFNSSPSEFGSFILHAGFVYGSIDFQHTIFMISFESDYEEGSSGSSSSYGGHGSSPWWTSTDGLTGACFDDDDDNDACFDDGHDDQLKLDDLGVPSCYQSQDFEKYMAGSCNGLVCIQDTDTRPHDFSLWNPATGEFRVLPKCITNDARNINFAAFGFDVATKDYKVLLLTALKPRWNGRHGPTECFCLAEVYSLSTDSWRLLEGIPCLPGHPFCYTDSVLYLNGSCFFLAHFFYTEHPPVLPVNDRFIISFDFTKEIITPIQLPDHDRNQELRLCYLGDKIALFMSPRYFGYTRIRPSYEDFSIWVLNYEHGSSVNKESWTKLHSFRIQLKKPDISYIPRGISNDGKYALLEYRPRSGLVVKMNLYNLVTNEFKKKNFLCCSKVMSNAHAYKPSLVSVIGGNGGAAAAADRMIGGGKPSFNHRWKWWCSSSR